MKKPRGRPPIDNPASERLPTVRVSPDQLQAYQDAASSSGLSFSAWAKHHLDRAARREHKREK